MNKVIQFLTILTTVFKIFVPLHSNPYVIFGGQFETVLALSVLVFPSFIFTHMPCIISYVVVRIGNV
jgi:hypothetical protein